MNKNSLLFIPLAVIFLVSCGNSKNGLSKAPGTIIAREEMPVVGDTLNKFTFSVTIKVDSEVDKGVYDVTATWGHNTANSKFTMPKGGEDLVPILRKSNKPNAFIIGFKAGKDTTFDEYIEVSGMNGTIKMIYTKAYSFE
jgi:hypothetical protein